MCGVWVSLNSVFGSPVLLIIRLFEWSHTIGVGPWHSSHFPSPPHMFSPPHMLAQCTLLLIPPPQVLAHGTPLLSSTGDEFALENDPDYQKMSFQERASFHRQQLQEQLGLVSQGKVFSTGLETLIDDSDLEVSSEVPGHLSSGRQLLQQHIQKVHY